MHIHKLYICVRRYVRRTALTISMFLLRFQNYILYYFIVVPLPYPYASPMQTHTLGRGRRNPLNNSFV